MKKLFRTNFATVGLSDLLIILIFYFTYDYSLEWGLAYGFILLGTHCMLLAHLVIHLTNHFTELYPQIKKKIYLYYLGILLADFLILIILSFSIPTHPFFILPALYPLHFIFYQMIAKQLRENYPDDYNQHISFWDCM